MKCMNRLLSLTLFVAVLFMPTGVVHADGLATELLDGRVIFGDNFTLAGNDTLTGDLVVFGGNVIIEKGATVQGDLVVLGGSVSLDGTVTGSAVIIAGSTDMGATAVVNGDFVTIGGSVQRDPNSQVDGEVITNVPLPSFQVPNLQAPNMPNSQILSIPQPNVHVTANPLGRVLRVLGTTMGLALLALLTSLFLQPQIERVSQAVVGQPIVAGSVGLLVVVLSPIVLLILAVTIILFPVALLAAFVLALAWLFGVVAIGTEVGERFTRAINQTWAPPLTAGFGTFLLMLVVGGIDLVPCVGRFAPFLVALLGIGGVVLTMFGSQTYPHVEVSKASPESDSVR